MKTITSNKEKDQVKKLEELNKEEFLKLYEKHITIDQLANYLNRTPKEVDDYRKKVLKIKNINLEKFYHNFIVFIKNIRNDIPDISDKYLLECINAAALGWTNSMAYSKTCYNKLIAIDWLNLDIEKEIKENHIDVIYRTKVFPSKIYEFCINSWYKENPYDDNEELSIINKTSYFPKKANIKYQPVPSKKPRINKTTQYARSTRVAINALANADYLCEINNNHPVFRRKNNCYNYTEPHHLIPMTYQYLFTNSIDIEANIVSLCSYCHDEIHHGANYQQLVTKLYNERKDLLKKCGIDISLDYLLMLYEKIDNKNFF